MDPLVFIIGPAVAIIVFIVLWIVPGIKKSGGPSPLSGTPPTQARLEELDSLRDSGAITETEYAEKRRQILDEV